MLRRDQQVVSELVEETLNKKNTISIQDLIIKEKIGSQSETTQTVSALKLPILKTGDYELWSIRMEQYLTHTDYALWEVIVNGNAPAVASASVEGPIPPKIAEQKLARKNELKAKSTLLLAIPDEHLLKFQKLISQLEIHGEVISQEDANLKLLRSLPLAWNTIALIMRNKSDLDTMSIDDLYNNLKVYEAEIKSQLSSSSNSQNVAFVSSENTSITNEAVNTAHEVSTTSSHPQLDNKDLEQIDTNDLEEMDLKWQVTMLTMRVKRFLKKIGRNLNLYGKETVGFDKTDMPPIRINISKTPAKCLGVQDGIGLESLEARIVLHQKNEAVYEEDIAFLKYDVKKRLLKRSSEKLTKLINSQIRVNNKSGVGFDSQMNENELHDCHLNKREVFESASDSSVNEIEEENNQVNDRFKKVEGYHAVPPPYTGNYMPSRPDLSFAGLDDSVYKTNVSETITSVPRNESTASKSSKDSLEQPKDVRPSAPIIEEWESDSDDDCVFRPSIEQNKPSYAKINFVKSDENTRKSVIEQNTYRQAENLRKSQKAFSVDQETGQMLKCENDQRRHVVVVEKCLKFVSPIMSHQQQCGGYGPANNLEDSICSMKLRENIDDVSKAIFTTHNPDTLQLSAERCVLKSVSYPKYIVQIEVGCQCEILFSRYKITID
ncbi:ribonuclease H-like domain-containing protein [Tanacetum coccineum]|uniref:Ribonuclease H-like domain-containing protein n=1 Tax=Tanacetum coccineum TaxID=301880 RepID=A0ABQ5HL84_9ASTR